jgi:hypothetical protein
MTAYTEQKTQMHTKSTHICTSFTASPENSQVAIVVEFIEFAFVNGSYSELTFNSRDKGRALE